MKAIRFFVIAILLCLAVAEARKFGSKLEEVLQSKTEGEKRRRDWAAIVAAAKAKYKSFKGALNRAWTAIKTKWDVLTNPGCNNADALYAMVCADEQNIAAAYAPFFDLPMGAQLGNNTAKQALQTWWTANQGTVKGKMTANINSFVDTLATLSGQEKTDMKTGAATFAVDAQLDTATLVGPGYVQVAFAEAHAAAPKGTPGMAHPKYLEFAMTHENGHMLDPDVVNAADGGAHGAANVKALRAAKDAVNHQWAAFSLEVYADHIGAYSCKAFSKAEIIEAIQPFCLGGQGAGYPPTRDRVLILARTGAWYPTLCATNNGARGTAGTDYIAQFP